MLSTTSDLEELRRRLDGIDNNLQDLLVERMAVIARVAAQKQNGSIAPHVPAREAEMLRRLVERQGDRFPAGTLVRMWRELLAATTRQQGAFAIAAYAPSDGPGVWDLARDHYGSQTPLTAYQTAAQVIRAVSERRVSVGVLPEPQDDDADPWWRHLLSADEDTPRVVARLPFGPRGNARSIGDALAIGYGAQQPTGNDRTLLVTENAVQISRGRLVTVLTGVGLSCTRHFWFANADAANTLIEVEGHVLLTDPRLGALREQFGGDLYRLVTVGGYAVPLPSAVAAQPAGIALPPLGDPAPARG